MHFLVALALLKLCQKCTEVSMVEQQGTTGSPPGINLLNRPVKPWAFALGIEGAFLVWSRGRVVPA
jgi:hypothetical protein